MIIEYDFFHHTCREIFSFCIILQCKSNKRDVAQLVARHVRDVEVGCSSHLIPTVPPSDNEIYIKKHNNV